MTWNPDKTPATPPSGPGCGGNGKGELCRYIGHGPGMALICRHPDTPCWISRTLWACGCKHRTEWPGISVGEHRPKDPIKMADHNNRWADLVIEAHRENKRRAA